MRRYHLNQLMPDVMRLMVRHPYLLFLLLLTSAMQNALEPSIAWIGKKVIDGFRSGSLLTLDLMPYVPQIGIVVVGLGILKFSGKIFKKMYETRLVIEFQRTYLSRRSNAEGTEDISRVIYDCKEAKKGPELLYRDGFEILTQTISVIIWQVRLAPKWIPALLIASIPPLVVVFIFGPWIQRATYDILRGVRDVAQATGHGFPDELVVRQEFLFRSFVRKEYFRGGAEVIGEIIMWLGIFLLFFVGSILPRGWVLPETTTAGEIVFFITNFNLLSKPISAIGRMYTKFHEAYPALQRTLLPKYEKIDP